MGRRVVLQPSIALTAYDTYQDPALAVDVADYRECLAVWHVQEFQGTLSYLYVTTAIDPCRGGFGSQPYGSHVRLSSSSPAAAYSVYLKGFARYLGWRVTGSGTFSIRFSLELFLKGPVARPSAEIAHAHGADGLYQGEVGPDQRRGCSRRLW